MTRASRLTTALILGCVTSWSCAEAAPLRIPYLAQAPQVDGTLDPGLERLAPAVLQGPAGSMPVRVRLGYGAHFLYAHVEVPRAGLVVRENPWQHGDGLALTVGRPGPKGAPTDAYRVLAVGPAPSDSGRGSVTTWYVDRRFPGFPAVPNAQVVHRASGGKVEMELLVPWSALAPYHPWREPPGLNLTFVEAADEGTVRHALVDDPFIGAEEHARRVASVRFEEPPAGALAWSSHPEALHVPVGEPLKVEVRPRGQGDLAVEARLEVKGQTRCRASARRRAPGAPVLALELSTAGLEPGRYDLAIADEKGGTDRFTVALHPRADLDAHGRALASARALPEGSRNTLLYRLEALEAAWNALRAGDPGTELLAEWAALARDFEVLAGGADPVATCTSLQRRAHRSRWDGSLQPYSIRPIAKPEPGRRYPLLVHLHGSAQDDRVSVEGPARALPDVIVAAPFARGLSHAYLKPGVMESIEEVIEDVIAHYPVDPERIFLSGYSMGGYGVLLAGARSPARYRGLLVLAGNPSMGRGVPGGPHPDFSDREQLAVFAGKDFFVAHGAEDRNSPVAGAEALVHGLEAAGARVTFVSVPKTGHGIMNREVGQKLATWLEERIRAAP